MIRMDKKTKKIVKVILYVVLALTATNSSQVATTHSKYMESEDYALVFENQLYQLNQGSLTLFYDKYGSTPEQFHTFFNITPEDIGVTDSSKITYQIVKPSGCNLVLDERTVGNVLSHNRDNTEIKIQGETQIDVLCNPDDASVQNGSYWRIDVSIWKKVENEDQFLYKSGSLPLYERPYQPEVDDNKIVEAETDADAFERLFAYLKEYVKSSGVSQSQEAFITGALETYISQYKDGDVIDFSKTLPGLIVKKEGNQYTFSVEENLFGYARTLSDRSTAQKYMYFYLDTASDHFNDSAIYVFEYYLKNYYYIEDEESLDLVMTYVNVFLKEQSTNFGSFLQTGVPTLGGVRVYSNPLRLRLSGTPNLLDSAKAYFSQPASIAFDTQEQMQQAFTDYMSSLKNNNPIYASMLSDAAVEKISTDKEILASIARNSTGTRVSTFEDYFEVYDEVEDKYLMVTISSDGVENFVEISELITKENVQKNTFDALQDVTFTKDSPKSGYLDVTLTLQRQPSPSSDAPEEMEPGIEENENEVMGDSSEVNSDPVTDSSDTTTDFQEEIQDDAPLTDENVSEPLSQETAPSLPEESSTTEEEEQEVVSSPSEEKLDKMEEVSSSETSTSDSPLSTPESLPDSSMEPEVDMDSLPILPESIDLSQLTEEERASIMELIQLLDEKFGQSSILEDGTLASHVSVLLDENDQLVIQYLVTMKEETVVEQVVPSEDVLPTTVYLMG